MLARALVSVCSLLLASCGPARSQAPEPPSRLPEVQAMPFDAAVDQLVQTLRAGAEEGIRIELQEIPPRALGWKAPEGSPARLLALWAPSGVNLHLGLLPRRGRLEHAGDLQAPDPGAMGGTPRLIAVGPGLVVVDAPSPAVALTLEVERRDSPRLQATAGAIHAWAEGEVLEGPARPAGLKGATRVIRHPHWLEIELSPGASLDPASLLAAGESALSFREAPPVEGGLLPVPTLLFASP